jgi:titin
VGGVPVTAYDVYRGTSAGGETHVVVATLGTGYVDATATPGVTYYYVVEAVTAEGVSPPSNEAWATAGPPPSVGVTPPSGPPPPSSPRLIVVAGPARATLSWLPPSAGGPVVSYAIYRGTSPDGEFSPVSTNTTSYVDLTVTPGVEYFYVVRARGPGGLSPPSNEVEVVPFRSH